MLRYGCVLTVAVCHFRFLRAFSIASSRTQPFITDMRGRGGGAAAAAAAPSTSLSKCRTGQESRSESSSSSNSSSSSDQEQDSEQHSHTGRAPDSVSADREGGASSGAMAREKHRPENGVLGVLIRRRHRVEMGWFDTFYTFSHLFCERKRGVT